MSHLEKFDINNYQFNKESKNGVYIIHGFTNTTYEVKELALYLSKQGFYTRADNLPGHGTTVEDCNRYKYTDWMDYVEQGVGEMIAKCDNIYVVGISMGSVLALHLSSIFPFNAAVFASTVLDFKNKFSVNILSPLLHRLFPSRHKLKTYKQKTYKQKTLVKDKHGSIIFFGYQEWPSSAVNEMRKLTNNVRNKLYLIKCPALIIHSKADLLSPQSNFSLVYDSISSENKEKFIPSQAGHNLFAKNPEQEIIFKKVTKFLNNYNS